LVDAISTSLERKQYCSCVCLDISQAFDRVWKLSAITALIILIISYRTDRFFQIRSGSSISEIALINAGVPQEAIQSSLLFNIIYASDQSVTQDTVVALISR